MHAECKKATQTSKAADNEREGVLYLNPLNKAITCTQFEIRHLIKIEVSSFFAKLKLGHHDLPHGLHIQIYILQDQQRGHGVEVVQVLHIVPHAKEVLHKAEVGKKSGNNRKQCTVILCFYVQEVVVF